MTVVEGGESIAPLHHPAGVLVTIGVDRSAAPVAIRERVAPVGKRLDDAHRDLDSHPAMGEVAILSTCDRTELYVFTGQPDHAAESARTYLVSADPAVRPYLREWRGMSAARHLLRVSAGLESRVLGENQILSQVREALASAERVSTIGPHLHQLFRSSIRCGREVRRTTGLGRVDSSIASKTVRTAERLSGPLPSLTALIIGGGEMSRLMAAELRRRGIGRLYVANRTPSVAEDLARRFQGVAVPLAEVARCLSRMDIVVSATSAPGRILGAQDVSAVQPRHQRAPLHVFDLAVPRDIDPAIGRLPGIILHDLDSLTPDRVRGQRAEDIRAAESIVCDHLRELERWYRVRRTAPLIAELRRWLDETAASELDCASPRLSRLSQDEREAVERLAGRLTDAIFHRFVTRLRLAACIDDRQLSDAAEFFFGSDTDRSQEAIPIGVRSMERVRRAGGEIG